ncbi:MULTISPECIES: hypothetical protein [Achromobacter]|uniref:hypothetical protein n=1 Tax=Achromobacter TaxID=222 RepID=UPI0023F8A875|nr:hypothetical protein [Achromobacter anxifer]MDF8365090.1 hypothetical protein [Achromobacter anxifer]
MHNLRPRRASSASCSKRLHLAEREIYLLSQEIDHTWELMLGQTRQGRGLTGISLDRVELARRVAYLPVCAESYRIPFSYLDNLLQDPDWMPPEDCDCDPSGIGRLRSVLADIERRVEETADPVILEAWNKQNAESIVSIPRLLLSHRASATEHQDVYRVTTSGEDPGRQVEGPI